MPHRHLCPAFENEEDCEEARCLHAADGTQYLFESVVQAMCFMATPGNFQELLCSLLDLGFDTLPTEDC